MNFSFSSPALKAVLFSAAAFLCLSVLPASAAPAASAAASPAAGQTQSQPVCTVRSAYIGMTEAQLLEKVGKPTFKGKKKNSWHYRHKPGAPEGISDPRIIVRAGKAHTIVGSCLELDGRQVLKSGDSSEKIQEVLGACPKIVKGAGKDVTVMIYSRYHLQVALAGGKAMAFCLSPEF